MLVIFFVFFFLKNPLPTNGKRVGISQAIRYKNLPKRGDFTSLLGPCCLRRIALVGFMVKCMVTKSYQRGEDK